MNDGDVTVVGTTGGSAGPGDAAAAAAAVAAAASAPPPPRHHARLDALPAEELSEPPSHIMERFRSYNAETIKVRALDHVAYLAHLLSADQRTHSTSVSFCRTQGYNFTHSLKARMEFQNPYILEAVAQQFSIDEIGACVPTALPACRAPPFRDATSPPSDTHPVSPTASNYPAHVFDPHGFPPAEYYDELAVAQQRAEEERAAAQSSAVRGTVPFQSGGVQLPAAAATIGGLSHPLGGGRVVAAAPAGGVAVAAAVAAAREAAAAAARRAGGAGPAGPAATAVAEPRRSKWDAER